MRKITGIIVYPSGLSIYLEGGETVWIDCHAAWKASLLQRQVLGEHWGDFITVDYPTEKYEGGFPVVSYLDEDGQRRVQERVRKEKK